MASEKENNSLPPPAKRKCHEAKTNEEPDINKKVCSECEEELDPVLGLLYAPAAMIHQCLAVAGSPLAQGNTQQTSHDLFVDWCDRKVRHFVPGGAVLNGTTYSFLKERRQVTQGLDRGWVTSTPQFALGIH